MLENVYCMVYGTGFYTCSKLRKKEWTKIQLNIYINLLIAYVIFMAGVSRVDQVAACNAVAFLLQYFFLVSWCWIGVYGRKLYTSLVKVRVAARRKLREVFGSEAPTFLILLHPKLN